MVRITISALYAAIAFEIAARTWFFYVKSVRTSCLAIPNCSNDFFMFHRISVSSQGSGLSVPMRQHVSHDLTNAEFAFRRYAL